MTLRRTLGLLAAPALLVVGATGVAAAGSADRPGQPSVSPRSTNSGASVAGVGQCDIASNSDCWAWIDPTNGTPCPDGHFCVYTGSAAGPGVKIFSFYHCTDNGSEWALQNWDGEGYYHNSNAGGAHAYLKDVNHNVLMDSAPASSGGYDFTPVWYVRAC